MEKEAGIVEDKTFELIEKMYSDINKRFDNLEDDIRHVKNDIQHVKKEILHVGNQVTNLEDNHGKKLDALFDGYKQTYEKLQEHDKRFDDVESKLDNLSLKVICHDSKLEVLEGGRKK